MGETVGPAVVPDSATKLDELIIRKLLHKAVTQILSLCAVENGRPADVASGFELVLL